jgi:ATP-dependent RNA helicase DHX37/DHR1
MRRSKSNPAKYAKGYRKISQRRMTSYDDNEEEEMKRLRDLLRTSSEHLSNHCNDVDNDNDVEKNKDGNENENENEVKDDQKNHQKKRKHESTAADTHKSPNENEDNNDMETDEDDSPQYVTDETKLMLPARKRNTGPKTKAIILTPEEIKHAKNKHKALQRKLQQIETRHEKKKRRSDLYKKLSDFAVSDVEMTLLGKSSELGKKVSKKQMLKKILQKERAGIALTDEERDLLYVEREEVPTEEMNENLLALQQTLQGPSTNDVEVEPLAFPTSGKKKSKKKKKTTKAEVNSSEEDKNESTKDENKSEIKDLEKENNKSTKNSNTDNDTDDTKPLSFAEQMMSGISNLKTKTTNDKIEEDERLAKEAEARLEQQLKEEEEERRKRAVYVPKNPIVVKTAATMGLKPKQNGKIKENWRILSVDRPDEIKEKRYDLPVSSMEYEIIDSIRNNDVTILCSETGSGKSTQVPQFLYESGMTLGNASSQSEDEGLLICVTQPRRVAAVSTAKRVCYEMGHSVDKGQSIRNSGKRGEGNLVAYQTKYETAGVGSKTRVKFMTDGILLQEIKSDLLLRKYAAIVLDEAHERNLNTDVLLGLLSAALPLRKKASLEGSLPPLKVVIMSATLRVEDFTANGKLFISNPPNLVKVPGRTFPVTIHHSKTTELDDYEGIALQKVCKIHRKLPSGGILVFLTGKQEIIRMVNRLRRRLLPKGKKKHAGLSSDSLDIDINEVDKGGNVDSGLRDMDDDEADGDLYQRVFDDSLAESDGEIDDIDQVASNQENKSEDNIPKKVVILPLYSLLSVKDQAKVFEPIDEDTRLIVVATNIAETSLTIPGISYVVDTGRQKCRNYHAGTGVASYDVMWISKASADQRAGRAGRTGPGHCYRIFSSSVYARHLDAFALPEVLTRPLEDVVLAMKAMGISNVGNFPFPTSPDPSQLNAAVKLLANIGCVDTSNVEVDGGDGEITLLGTAISQLPIGVRYGKMLLIAAQANVLDYGIVMVSVLSESSPFGNANAELLNDSSEDSDDNSLDGLDEVDRNNVKKQENKKKKESRRHRWCHNGGDVLAGILASGAFSYAGRGAGGLSESLACKRFCEENGLNLVVMQRIQKMRVHLARLAHQRLGNAEGIAAKTGKVLSSMAPPKSLQESLLRQAIASGLLDNVARRSTQGRLGKDGMNIPRTAFFSCRSTINEPLFIDKKSVLFSRDPRQLPEWICYDSIIRKTTKDGETISTMTNVTPIDPSWLGELANGSQLLSLGEPIDFPTPKYDPEKDAIMCSVVTKYGDQGWLLPPVQRVMSKVLKKKSKQSSSIISDDPYRWFARNLLEGKVLEELKGLKSLLNDDPSIITRRKPVGKVAMLVSSLSEHEIDSSSKLINYWAEQDSKFLFKILKSWVKKKNVSEVKRIWIDSVKKRIKEIDES